MYLIVPDPMIWTIGAVGFIFCTLRLKLSQSTMTKIVVASMNSVKMEAVKAGLSVFLNKEISIFGVSVESTKRQNVNIVVLSFCQAKGFEQCQEIMGGMNKSMVGENYLSLLRIPWMVFLSLSISTLWILASFKLFLAVDPISPVIRRVTPCSPSH